MRVLMMGTGPFAVPALRSLRKSTHDVVAVVTRPPRGRRPQPPPMQVAAEKLGLRVLQPETANCDPFRATIAEMQLELLVVCDYGEILKPDTLAATAMGGVNLHGSLLPKYRGAAPVQWAVLNGETETGNTVIQMTPGLDAGPCLGVQRVAINPEETAGELEERLALLGGDLVVEVVDQLESGAADPIPQDAGAASKAPRLKKEHGRIDWKKSSVQIKNQVRALQPWPRAYSSWVNPRGVELRFIVLRTAIDAPVGSQFAEASGTAPTPGTIVDAKDRLVVMTGDGRLEILELQPAGKRAMTAREFLRGQDVNVGDTLAAE